METLERIDRLESTVEVLVRDVAELKDDHVSRADLQPVMLPLDLLQARIKLDVAELIDASEKRIESRQDARFKEFEIRQDNRFKDFEIRQDSRYKDFLEQQRAEFKAFQAAQNEAMVAMGAKIAGEVSARMVKWFLGGYTILIALTALLWSR